ncbi:uncharacterized protein LOC122016339 isoform X2 [Zingiber officinale]|uniref:uncharacterized protein LOC122016339 isoform X2 n=1 Tax=Zingiber officinale TaxID=94328 RepID=UPI001C4C716F|nr:uncharacterized protein LOC122016339 isoform X2 [Zingiber officinale]
MPLPSRASLVACDLPPAPTSSKYSAISSVDLQRRLRTKALASRHPAPPPSSAASIQHRRPPALPPFSIGDLQQPPVLRLQRPPVLDGTSGWMATDPKL